VRALKVLLTPRWLGYTLLAVLAIALFIFLGRWQWHSAMSASGTLQNLFYAFNWWLFAVLVVYGYGKTLHEDVTDAVAERDPEVRPERVVPLPALYRKPRPADLDAPLEDDPELAAYNAYLAQLNERSAN
jgi:DNA-binding transcriptional regulator of glucitol operon